MKPIVLISCVSKKQSAKATAEELYISPLFRMNLSYAKSMRPKAIYILSAKHGLLSLDETIAPYNTTLNTMKQDDIKKWATKVLGQMKGKIHLRKDRVIFLAGERYRKYLVPHIAHYSIPMQGLGIGKQLQFLKRKLK